MILGSRSDKFELSIPAQIYYLGHLKKTHISGVKRVLLLQKLYFLLLNLHV